MATVNKDFKIKQGLVVEGATATVAGNDVLTKAQADQDYIISLAGGGADSANVPNKVVKRDANGNFAAGEITADLIGDVTGDVSGSAGTAGTVDSLSNHNTDALGEGSTNLYYTDARVKDVLTGSTQTNISITEVSGELHITAENGVADSTTDDLDEGTTNKYFTDARARLALSEGTGINYDNTTGSISADLGDFDTDDLTEGASNKYFTTARIDNHLSGGDGITYSSGSISADLGTGLNISGGQIAVDRSVVDGWYDASGAATTAENNAKSYADSLASNYDAAGAATTAYNNAVADAASDATTKANNAESNANDYTDGEIITALSTAQGYANTAEQNANAYTDNAVAGLNWKQSVNLLYDAAIPTMSGSGASQLIIDGHDPLGDADSGYRILITQSSNAGIHVFNSTSGNWTLTRAEDADAFAELVGAAVYVMEGTQYGSTSWVQSNHYITDFTGQSWTQFSGQGSVTAGTGITVDGLEVSVNRTTVDTWYDAAGSASTAQSNAEDYADGLAINYDAAGTATTEVGTHSGLTSGVHGVTGNVVGTSDSQTLTNKTIDASSNTISNIANSSLVNDSITINGSSTALGSSVTLDTDDVSEGTNNWYFTSSRARESLSAGNAISYNNGTGEIAVDASQLDTGDIAEGTNLYYTDTRVKNLLTSATQNNIVIEEVGGQLIVTAENGVADSTTDNLSEGTVNHYFTDQRAQDAVAGDIADAVNDINNTINALTTTDIEEGTNLYFTNTRAQDAVASDIAAAIAAGDGTATPTYSEINFTGFTKQVGAYSYIATAGSQTVYTWYGSNYPAAKFLVRVRAGNHSQISEILLTKDNNGNVAITEYAIVYTNGVIGDITATYSNNVYSLNVNATENATEVIVSGMLLAYGD